MRKRYHFRPGDHGLDAWDVDGLVELSRDLPLKEVDIRAIGEIDAERPHGAAVIEHMKLVTEVDIWYPILLSAEGRVMDEMHRFARVLLDGRNTIRAVRLPWPIARDFPNCRPQDLPY